MSSAATLSPVDTGILLEAGTNEAELLVFHVRDKRFGVNVAKVREVLPIEGFTDIPKSHPVLGEVPVIVFSSIATKDNEKKGLQVGATVQVSKPHYDDLVATVGRVLEEATM